MRAHYLSQRVEALERVLGEMVGQIAEVRGMVRGLVGELAETQARVRVLERDLARVLEDERRDKAMRDSIR